MATWIKGTSCGVSGKKLHQFLFGHHFKIYTDHKLLFGLLSSERAIPLMASSRIQRRALTLSAYKHELFYCPDENQSGYEPLNLEKGSSQDSHNFDATDLRF